MSSAAHGTLSRYSNQQCRCELCSEAARIYFAAYRARKRQERIAYAKQYYVDHKQELKTRNAHNYAEKPEYKTTREKWNKEHPERMRALKQKGELNRRARKRNQFVEDIDPQVVFERDQGICGICGTAVIGKFHVDHVIPLSKGGLHTYGNVQTVHPICNERKGPKLQEEICQTSNK
jgi:5-methylcytosine-specific restriction endonuclease McrA